MTTGTIPKYNMDVGDTVTVNGKLCKVLAKYKREYDAKRAAAAGIGFKFTRLDGVGWVIIQPLNHEGPAK